MTVDVHMQVTHRRTSAMKQGLTYRQFTVIMVHLTRSYHVETV